MSRYDWEEFWMITLGIASIVTCTIATVGVLVYGTGYIECQGFSRATGHAVKYDWACYVEVNGKYVPRKYVYGEAVELRGEK